MIEEKAVWKALASVTDPEIGLSVVDLGLIYEVKIKGSEVVVKMTLTNPQCPLQGYLKSQVEETVSKLPDVQKCRVELVFEPAWTPERISAEARKKLGIEL